MNASSVALFDQTKASPFDAFAFEYRRLFTEDTASVHQVYRSYSDQALLDRCNPAGHMVAGMFFRRSFSSRVDSRMESLTDGSMPVVDNMPEVDRNREAAHNKTVEK